MVSQDKEKRLGKHRIGALVYAIAILAGQFHMPSGKGSMCQTSNMANNAPEIGLRKRAQLSPYRFLTTRLYESVTLAIFGDPLKRESQLLPCLPNASTSTVSSRSASRAATFTSSHMDRSVVADFNLSH